MVQVWFILSVMANPLKTSQATGVSGPQSRREFSAEPLGILGEMSGDLRKLLNHETGEVLQVESLNHEISRIHLDDEQLRSKRFYLLNVIAGLLGNDFRVSSCHKFATGLVQIFFSTQFQRAHVSGLTTCGSVWVCPVCSAKITSKRASSLKEAIDIHHSNGGSILMMTLTAPHTLDDALSLSLGRWKKGLTKLHDSYAYKAFSKDSLLKGHVRSLEITFSEISGWHVHAHYLLFYSGSHPRLEDFSLIMLPIWQKSAVTAGFKMPNWRGLDVRIADDLSGDYVSKWGIHNELVKANFKNAKSETSYSPFEMISDFGIKPILKNRFMEYAKATTASTHGIKKGMNHISFSRTLNQYLTSIGFTRSEKSDQDLVEEQTARAVHMLDVSKDDFTLLSSQNLLAAFLAAAKRGTENANLFLFNLRSI